MNQLPKHSRLKIIRKDNNGNDVETELNLNKTPEQLRILQSMKKTVKPARYLTVEQACNSKYRKYRDRILVFVMKKLINDYTEKAKQHINEKMAEEEEYYDY